MSDEYRKDDEEGAPDAKGATEDDLQKIPTIRGGDVLGYQGGSTGEHSGQNATAGDDVGFADNDPEDLPTESD